jgi:hypothetical protein
MGVACHWLASQLGLLGSPNLGVLALGLALTISAGVAVYLGMAWLLRSDELGEVYTLATGRGTHERKADSK